MPMQLTGGDGGGITVEIRKFGYEADDAAAELANARARLVELQAVPLLPAP